MANNNKILKQYKYGLAGNKKKLKVNYWRFIFKGAEVHSGAEQMFFIEIELLNSTLSPSEVQLGFKTRTDLSEEDLQYALAGTQSAKTLGVENHIQPSYCCIRVCKLSDDTKQLCYYFPAKNIVFQNNPFEMCIDGLVFTLDKLSGAIKISDDIKTTHPEMMTDSGEVSWDIRYEVNDERTDGYKGKKNRWFPYGLTSLMAGKITFDGVDYIIDPRKCSGYVERYWGSSFPESWFHLSSGNLTSVITGKTLQNSSCAIQGIFDGKVSFVCQFEDFKLDICADSIKKQEAVVWDCTQMPEAENLEENQLHWSVSIDNKGWIVDVDIYCKIKDLFNRSLELPEGNRRVLNLVEGASGTGEIKIYKKIGLTLEQIEHVELVKVICEFGQAEESDS